MRHILETIFLAIFTKIDNNVKVFEEAGAMYFCHAGKIYKVTVEEI